MTGQLSISRRQLIVGGLMVAFACGSRSRAATSPSAIGGFVRISPEGGISLVMPSVEMGQGIYTAEAALLAEELDVRLDQIVAIAAPPDASLYAQPLFKGQLTGGSTSIRGFWTPLRQAGAAARSMLVAAAAQAWGVHPNECSTKDGTILHSSTGRALKYEEVAESAANQPIPEDPKLKSPGEFKIIGKSQRRIDTPAKVNGSAVYGIDVTVDGMKYDVSYGWHHCLRYCGAQTCAIRNGPIGPFGREAEATRPDLLRIGSSLYLKHPSGHCRRAPGQRPLF
jgi:isoquinoline 1-oxidoreductase subunit beta